MPIQFPSWSQTKTTSKQGFDKVYNVVDKLGAPVNKLSNKLGSEAFWPTTLDKESDKAARILRSFCKDGFYVAERDGHIPSGDAPRGTAKVIKKIPTEVIKKAKGLAIFTTMRTGLWVSGAGGSGILVARKADGNWSPPSGILLHTAGLGFLIGVDIYDCVVVINTDKALQAFTKIRCTLGGEVSAVAGPVGIGGILETEMHKRQAPVWNYLKSRGFYAGVQIDGTVIIERQDENERFYGQKLEVADILAGKVRHEPYEIRTLMATIKAAQGDSVDESALPAAEPTPGDFEVAEDQGHGFGLPPSEDDPDPFGVHALEQEGMEIREAGTKSRPSSDAFEYKPAPSSPIFRDFGRQNSTSKRLSKRDSGRLSIASAHTDRGTQTELLESARFAESSKDSGNHSPVKKTSENLAEEVDDGDSGHDRASHDDETPEAPVISKAKLVTIPKRIPPALPPRSPYRNPPPVSDADSPKSPNENEHQASGLGIDLTSPLEDISHQDSESLIPSMNQEALEEKLNGVHLTPRQDLDRLSPRKDGFDEISMSGSDYSAETPSRETPIAMNDNESKSGLAIDTAKENERPAKAVRAESEVFHSIPSTPIEATAHGEHANVEDKEDFS
ncbi:hypothetical protein MMC28_000492 [Mycoblastus sanguinarius]|nr:hypothetical protein [Mycoblastus sanguinarius]